MKIKRFTADTSREALIQVRELFGAEAVILSNKKIGSGVEVIAAIDFDFSKDGYFNKEVHEASKREEEEQDKKFSAHSVQTLQQEIEALKLSINSNRQSGAMYDHPIKTIVANSLIESGYFPLFVEELLSDEIIDNHINTFKRRLYDKIKEQYIKTGSYIENEQNTCVFVGLSGSGKSTALIKSASDIVRKNGPKGVVIYTTDDYKASGYLQLKSYADILGVPVRKIKKLRELDDVFNARYSHIFIDTDPMFLQDREGMQFLSTLTKIVNKKIKIFQIISATDDVDIIQEQLAKLSNLKSSCIVTKIDESTKNHTNKILSMLMYKKRPISYLNTRFSISEKMIQTNSARILRIIDSDEFFIKQEKEVPNLIQEKINATT